MYVYKSQSEMLAIEIPGVFRLVVININTLRPSVTYMRR